MTEQDLVHIWEACSIKWAGVDIGGVEGHPSRHPLRANHVYVDCEKPFLVAATSVDLSSGEEIFGLTIVRSVDAIEAFIKGPFYPHNEPKTLSLRQVGGNDVDGFMNERKELDVARRTWKDPAASGLVTMVQGLSITSQSGRLRVNADDAVPMSLVVSWSGKNNGGRLKGT